MKDDEAVVAVNYWKESRKEVKKLLSEPWKTLLLFHNSQEVKEIADFIKKLSGSKKIVYISLTRTDNAIIPSFKDADKSLFIVDCISSGVFEKKNTKTSFFENSPSTFDEIIALNEKYLNELHPDLVILDSLSQFIDFSTLTPKYTLDLYKYLNSLKNIRAPCRFILLYMDSRSKDLVFVPTYDVDLILRMEVIVEKIYWNG